MDIPQTIEWLKKPAPPIPTLNLKKVTADHEARNDCLYLVLVRMKKNPFLETWVIGRYENDTLMLPEGFSNVNRLEFYELPE